MVQRHGEIQPAPHPHPVVGGGCGCLGGVVEMRPVHRALKLYAPSCMFMAGAFLLIQMASRIQRTETRGKKLYRQCPINKGTPSLVFIRHLYAEAMDSPIAWGIHPTMHA